MTLFSVPPNIDYWKAGYCFFAINRSNLGRVKDIKQGIPFSMLIQTKLNQLDRILPNLCLIAKKQH